MGSGVQLRIAAATVAVVLHVLVLFCADFKVRLNTFAVRDDNRVAVLRLVNIIEYETPSVKPAAPPKPMETALLRIADVHKYLDIAFLHEKNEKNEKNSFSNYYS